jgi:phosphatidylserine decarboxylase
LKGNQDLYDICISETNINETLTCMKLHREGYTIMAVTAIILILINLGINYLLPEGYWIPSLVLIGSVIVFLLVVQFFRVPTRTVYKSDRQIVAPCDGKVVVIEEVVETEYFKGPRARSASLCRL